VVPLRYILRNIGRRRLRTALTTAGIAMVVALYFVMSSVAQTMVESFRSTGLPDEVVIVQAGALTVDFSNIDRSSLTFVQTLQGVASQNGLPLVSPELLLRSVGRLGNSESKISLRGVTGIAAAVYRQVRLAAGDWPGPGNRATLGSALAAKHGLEPGDTVDFEGNQWQVVGVLEAGGRVYDQEIWVDLDDLAASANRKTYSSFTLRAVDAATVPDVLEAVNEGRRFPLTALAASQHYQRTGGMAIAMASMGQFIAMIIAIGAIFGGMNTMYAAVAGRRHEIAMLRALGFRKRAILGAFLLESTVLAVVAGGLGLLIGWGISMLPIELPFAAEGAVRLSQGPVVASLVLAAIIGLIGGGLPALRAARTAMVDQLR
jgi:ABC-type antimicrobial peptide transport system permease subunit